jgi:hypothetical protein
MSIDQEKMNLVADRREATLAHEERRGSVVAEVWENPSMDGNKVYYDVKLLRFYFVGDEERRTPRIQQRDLIDLQIVSATVQQWIHKQHRVRRGVEDPS